MRQTASSRSSGFTMQRLGIIAGPEPDNPDEVGGLLNPGAARGRDGQLYLFPRAVAQGNYSRIGIARVRCDDQGYPQGIERLGYALEPTAPYERRHHLGGCEDARVSYVRPLGRYVMAYVAWGERGPRIALAVSTDLFTWQRLGLLRFGLGCPEDMGDRENKDGLFFPDVVPDDYGRPSLAILHRPMQIAGQPDDGPGSHPGIWLSHISLEAVRRDLQSLTCVDDAVLIAAPEQPWEQLKIGGGAPPVRTRHGWLLIYHGVAALRTTAIDVQHDLRYATAVMVLDARNPRRIRYRSMQPLLIPETPIEREGVKANVVFATGIDRCPPNAPAISSAFPEAFDIYYGMGDTHIGVARLRVPATLP